MSAPNLNYAWSRAIFQELQRAGVRHVVVCPGSRSSPLALAAAEAEGLTTWSVIDERSAAFFALGVGRESGHPAAVVATSGTAGAHFLPAAIEAAMSHVPLVLITADRPWELQGFGAPQTIPQASLFGRFAVATEELPVPEAEDACFLHLRAAVSRLIQRSGQAPRGPVHLNVPFREPLAPTPQPYAPLSPLALDGRAGRPFVEIGRGAGAPQEAFPFDGIQRGLLVCGPRSDDDGFGEAVHALARRLKWPVIAEAASQARFGFGTDVVAHADVLLEDAAFAGAMRPEAVIRFGGGLTSKRLQQWLDASGARIVAVHDDGAAIDPAHRCERVIAADAPDLCRAWADAVAEGNGNYRHQWEAAERHARAVLGKELSGSHPLSEPRLAREVAAHLPDGATLFVSSSMPIRELDAYASPERGPLRVLCNRGANGIDGIVSTALGAAASSHRPTVVLIGDVAFLHDLGGLLTAARAGLSLTVVVVNNDGGGIFSFLPIAGTTPHFEALFGTPHGLELAHAAALFGARHHLPKNAADLRDAVGAAVEGGLHLIEVRTRREENPPLHRALAAKVREGRRTP
ncbi:MAG: 2-succinyl-5-enolpyruvyl-6-hydroxy-3-cyclohexene-1-carboxylic-acid synthase [Myxococcaceae bacterium]|nr:2-succinyl-5-enolpyruvyl-6-hydroxy-3-cyclohexene-1-carboxylic-acid synthase [Myxococcaceae bacterium]